MSQGISQKDGINNKHLSGDENDDAELNTIGIDLGTTNSAVALYRHGQVEVVKNLQGRLLTASCVSYMKDSDVVLVGTPATEERTTSNYMNTIYDAKRLIGMSFNNKDVTKFAAKAPFKLINDKGKPIIEVTHDGKIVLKRPVEISAMVLADLRETAERRINGISAADRISITQAVITVPAYFSQVQKRDTLEAAKLAGLTDVKLLTEPAAAAYAYGFESRRNASEAYRMVVYDFGGGTFDITVLEVKGGYFKHLAIDGDIQLGGRDIDQCLRDYAADEVKRLHQKDLLADKRKAQKLLQLCEQLKKDLTTSESARIFLGDDFNIDSGIKITRQKFEELCHPFIKRSISIVKRTLVKAKLAAKQVNEVLMVGGTSKIPLVHELLVSEVGFERKILNNSVSAEEAVVRGAAIRAAQLAKNLNVLIDMTEVIPLSIGLNIDDDVFEPMIHRNKAIPSKVTHSFQTFKNNQKWIDFEIYEGERQIASKNNFLGKFSIKLEKMGMAGTVKVEITLELDENGLLHVYHKQNKKKVPVNMDFGPRKNTEREIEEVLKEAKRCKQEDAIEKQRLTAKFDLKLMIEEEKHCANSPRTKKVCKHYEDWMNSNPQTSEKMFKRKQSDFLNEISGKKLRS